MKVLYGFASVFVVAGREDNPAYVLKTARHLVHSGVNASILG